MLRLCTLLFCAHAALATEVGGRRGDGSLHCARVRGPRAADAGMKPGVGAIVGLGADMTYTLLPPSSTERGKPAHGPALAPDASGQNPEGWALVGGDLGETVPRAARVANAFTGTYLQALPDDGDDYSSVPIGPDGEPQFGMAGLQFDFQVSTAGTHALFLRWTGGDTVGGGDSLYVAVYDLATGQLKRGLPSFKPATVGILDTPGQFAGCCYSMITHKCACIEPVVGASPDVDPKCDDGRTFVSAKTAGGEYGVTCELPQGELTSVPSPRWYEFAGQQYGNVMDFDSEPWDGTCEAEGTGTADTGHDVAQWELPLGEYRIVFYPREDGTAFDAFYLAPPKVAPPGKLKLRLGASTIDGCTRTVPKAAPKAAPKAPTVPKDSGGGDGGGGDGGGGGGWLVFLLLVGATAAAVVVWRRKAGRAAIGTLSNPVVVTPYVAPAPQGSQA